MKKIAKYKCSIILFAVLVLAIVALVAPDKAEEVARAFMLIIVGIWKNKLWITQKKGDLWCCLGWLLLFWEFGQASSYLKEHAIKTGGLLKYRSGANGFDLFSSWRFSPTLVWRGFFRRRIIKGWETGGRQILDAWGFLCVFFFLHEEAGTRDGSPSRGQGDL